MSREPSLSDAERPSKTRLKAAMHELQALGEALVALPEAKLGELDLPEPLREAIVEFRRTRSHEGLASSKTSRSRAKAAKTMRSWCWRCPTRRCA